MTNPLRILFAIGLIAIFNLVATQRSLWQTGRVPQDPLEPVSGGPELLPLVRIWIDTDAACGATGRVVPDDCFAMLYGPVPVLFRSFESNTRHQGSDHASGDMAAIHCDEFKRHAVRIAQSSKDQKTIRGIVFPEDGLTRRQVVSDLGIGHPTPGKWVRAFSRGRQGARTGCRGVSRANERPCQETRILRV